MKTCDGINRIQLAYWACWQHFCIKNHNSLCSPSLFITHTYRVRALYLMWWKWKQSQKQMNKWPASLRGGGRERESEKYYANQHSNNKNNIKIRLSTVLDEWQSSYLKHAQRAGKIGKLVYKNVWSLIN